MIESLWQRIQQRNTLIQRYLHQLDVTFLLWILLELVGVAIAISLFEYFAAGWFVPSFTYLHPLLGSILTNGGELLNHTPIHGIGAMSIFLVLTWAQPRFLRWPQRRNLSLLLISLITGLLLWYAPPPLRLTLLISTYGVLAHARVALGRRGGQLVWLALIVGIVPVLWYLQAVTLLQFGIWCMGIFFVQTFTGLGMQERVPELASVDPSLVVSIDIGVNSLAAITINKPGFIPLLVNGRPVKSLNQGYNKGRAQLQSGLPEGIFSSRHLDEMTDHRTRSISYYLHTASRVIINHVVKAGIGTLVIGKNGDGSRKSQWARRATSGLS